MLFLCVGMVTIFVIDFLVWKKSIKNSLYIMLALGSGALFGYIFFATQLWEVSVRIGFLIIFLITSILLVRSVRSEKELKKRFEKTEAELQTLHAHVDEEIANQTVEVRKAYEMEKKSKEDLEKLDTAKTEFLLTMQHHLRTPLTVVRGYIKAIINEPESASVDVMKDSLGKADAAADKLSKLVNDLMGITQSYIGKDILNKKPFNQYESVTKIIKNLQSKIVEKQLTVSFTCNQDVLNLGFVGDREKIEAAFYNVIENAVKYTKQKGSIYINESVYVHPIEKTKFLKVLIHDTGVGMNEEQLGKLFMAMFTKTEEGTTVDTIGKGIGLTLTKGVINAHDGWIEVQSEGIDQGTTVLIYLPLANTK
jgi:signal transduction histidine kinase